MKYGKEITKEICNYIKNGQTQKDAAILSNITEVTLYEWINTKPEFSKSIKKAQAEFKKSLELTIKEATAKTWQAAAWLLERRFKDDYALRNEVTGKDGSPVAHLSDEELTAEINKILKKELA